MAGKISELTPENDPQDVDEIEFRDDSETPNTDAQNKAMTIKVLKGLSSWKQPVRAATTTNGTLATAYENGDSIDGVSLVTGNRILLKDQTTGSENGIYTVNASGAPTRATDFDTDTKAIANIMVPVEEGTVNADKVFKLITNNAITIGTTALTFEDLVSKVVTPLIVSASDETTVLSTGTAKTTFRMTFAMTLTEVRASLTVAGTGAALVTVDINEDGTSILSTKITIDATEKTSKTAATAPVISDTALADDAEVTVDIDTIDTDNVAKGLKIYLIGYKTP